MCNNQEVASLNEVDLQRDSAVADQQQRAVNLMDSPTVNPGSARSSNDDNLRVKFLCSFGGSILPRPQDGKLRYVGGETRIVCVPRDITYEELMGKMRELFEAATVLKYQQPDEDLDALVSVVNDDDVTNMMEEYDKLGSGDGFTKLRIFLSAQTDQEGSLHFGDGDERDNERRYVDALNSHNDSPDFRMYNGESPLMGPADDIHVAEQYFNQINLDGILHGHRNMDLPMAQMNLRNLTIPRLVSAQLQQPVNQRYNEMEAPWNPAYYSPRQSGNIDQRPIPEFPTSPSSSRYRTPYGDYSDKSFDRMPEDYSRPPINTHTAYEQQQQQITDNLRIPAGPVGNEKAGFPGNILQGSTLHEGGSICEHCWMRFQRNQVYPDSWRPGEQTHLEPPNMRNGYLQVPNSCTECSPSRETYMLNSDPNLHPRYSCPDQNDPRSIYAESHSHERGWVSPHLPNHFAEESRPHLSVSGRFTDCHIVENGLSAPLGHGNVCDGHPMQSHYIHHEDHCYGRAEADYSNQVLHDPPVPSGSQIHLPLVEDRAVRYGNHQYGTGNLYQVPHGNIHSQTPWGNTHGSLLRGPPHETSASCHPANGSVPMGFIRGTVESSPRLRNGVGNQNPWSESSPRVLGFNESLTPDYSHSEAVRLTTNACVLVNHYPCTPEPIHSAAISTKPVPSRSDPTSLADATCHSEAVMLTTNTCILENHNPCTPEPIQSAAILTKPVPSRSDPVSLADATSATLTVSGLYFHNGTCINQSGRIDETCPYEGSKETNHGMEGKDPSLCDIPDKNSGALATYVSSNPNVAEPVVENPSAIIANGTVACAPEEQPPDRVDLLPDLVAPVKEGALQNLKEVKPQVQLDTDLGTKHDDAAKEDAHYLKDGMGDNVDVEVDSDNENAKPSKIEPTKAEAEAIARGLQTIKNEDLEEIRELGCGTYGAVYHGKWKGSDVAIKRIKASCFAGKPAERERLIADFWKEALMLSSLHHPNVVAFYGVVRDGPDGSLATLTEFMVNGSLKQFLKKKDRTIDRRKRLIIAMDVAFGMEYLHGKNIVHFDLKCENLLVNMRDPHRPVCKIGDLGLSKVKQHTLVSGGVRGTLPWMAPELLSGKSNMVTEKIDVYSFGIVMWELLTGDEPYADMHCASIIGGIVNNTLRPEIPTWCDPEWKALMESCWASDPAQRPSFSEISQKLRSMAAAMNLK